MLRVIGCVVGAIVIILLYEMIGIFAAYKKQPELSEETKQGLHPEEIYTDATVEERACIIEENGDALLQRVRLIEQAKEDIVLSTFAFHDDDSGQIMMGALLRAAAFPFLFPSGERPRRSAVRGWRKRPNEHAHRVRRGA